MFFVTKRFLSVLFNITMSMRYRCGEKEKTKMV